MWHRDGLWQFSVTYLSSKFGKFRPTPCLKKLQTYFLSELCQISTDCENFWHKDSKGDKLFWGVLIFYLT